MNIITVEDLRIEHESLFVDSLTFVKRLKGCSSLEKGMEIDDLEQRASL
jgi:hypothetical protein